MIMSFFPLVICLVVGSIALMISAFSTAHGRKRRRIGSRAFQARLASPIALSLGCLAALAIIQLPLLGAAADIIASLLLTVLLASTLTFPAVATGIFLLSLTGFTNVFAAIAIIATGIALGQIIGYRWAGPATRPSAS
jgi:hypothetical protein